MTKLTGLTSEPIQVFQTPLENGVKAKFQLRYMPAVQMWFIDVEYGDFNINQMRLCNHINLLRQYRNVLPFGILVNVENSGSEPFLINDIQSGRVSIYILTESEVEEVEDAIAT